MKKLFCAVTISIFIAMSFTISRAETMLPSFIREHFEASGQVSPEESSCTDKIQHPQLSQAVDGVTFTLEEALYNGRTLFSVFTARSDVPLFPEFSETSSPEGKYLSIAGVDSGAVYGWHAEKFNKDGSLTLYYSQTYMTHKDVRDFTLRFKVRRDGTDQLSGENASFTLISQIEWTEQILADNFPLNCAILNVCSSNCALEQCIEVTLQFPKEMTEKQVADLSNSVVKLFDASSGKELPSINIAGKLYDTQGNSCAVPSPEGTLVSLFSLPIDYRIPESLFLEVSRVFTDGSTIDSCIISYATPE